ncbi:MAG: hypothetical protein Q7T10_15840 [Rhodoferax sp.]|uniref:hypothetical protein n=1 Tax=Rhodoferax sp. TaxID=50421 RepID=UPI00271A670D|nr:hypothetical protein [Rhodoferax sp.]MDO8450269.1 hypothetical protein [Rhodoferax sp.]
MNNSIKYLGPIILAEIYLISTLLIFSFGPIEYHLDDPLAFWFYIVLYHISMVLGYVLAAIPFKNRIKSDNKFKESSSLKIRVLILAAFLAFLIGHKNITMSDSLIPVDFISDITTGLLKSEEQYILKIERLEGYSGSKLLNIFNFFIAFTKIILIPVVIFYWEKLTIVDRVVALTVTFLPVLSGISTGTNKPLFDFVILYGSSLILYFVACFYNEGRFNFKSRRFFIVIIFMFFGAALWFFGTAMLGRGGDPSYVESTSPLGHIKLDYAYRNMDEESFLSYVYVWLSNYIVQGYYGFSQSLNVDFTSTLGFGNSQFLTRQIEWATGYDLSQYTYQHKIDAVWGETAQWHSLYSHIANDVHFLGVAVWNFIMGFYLAKLWRSLLDENNLYSKFLLPLFAVFIIFTPANNQVFGYLETFSAFFFMTLLWFGSVYGRRLFGRRAFSRN